MKTVIAVIAAFVVAAPAASAAPVRYKGKTDSGHKVTFTVKKKRIHDLTSGVRMSCVPIQGGGAPQGGPELFGFRGSVPLKPHVKWSFMSKPAFHYNEVTMNHEMWTKRRPGGKVAGRMRLQYSFLIPKYPPGTFSVYSCLGGAKFKAKRIG